MAKHDDQMNVKMSKEDKKKIQDKAEEAGFDNVSEYVRVVALTAEIIVVVPKKK